MKNIPRIINQYLNDAGYRFRVNAKAGLYKRMPDNQYLERMFQAYLGRKLDLRNPQTFNEKLQWLKLYDRNPLYTRMVDKYDVKEYVASIIGEEYIIPTLGVWNTFDEIDFESLPRQFVLKCTHDSGGLVIVKDKSNFSVKTAKKKIDRCLCRNFFYFGREWPYKDVKPRIIAEKYMEDSFMAELRDYKFFCFDGIVKCYKVDFDRFKNHHANYYDKDGALIQLGEEVCPPDWQKDIKPPKTLPLMKKFAEKLSEALPFLRVDFYDVNGRLYFGELTFYPASGFGNFIYEGNDELLGSWIRLPKKDGI